MELGGVTVQAASVGGVTERGLVAGEGVVCRCGPEACRGELALPVVPAVLIEVIREPVQRPARDAGLAVSQLLIAVPGAGSGGAGSGRAGTDAGERPADAFAGDGRVGQGLLQPVLAQGVPFGVGQVPGRGCFQEGLRQADPHAQAAGIHRRVDQRRRGGRRVAVPGQQLGRPGQELDDLPVLRRRGGLGQPRVPRLAELLQLRCGERGGHGDVVAGQQLPRLGMRIGAARRAGGQAVPELRPQRGQHQHRGAGRVPQQLPQPGGDPFAQPAVRDVEVELGLVQPHHGPRPDARQLAQRGIGAGRVDRMPQPPLLGSWSRSSCSASQQARVLPVEDPPTSTAIPLLPSAAARTTEPSSVSWSRGTYAGSAGSPGCGSSGCTGRCTSSANGSFTSASGHPASTNRAAACSLTHGRLSGSGRPRHCRILALRRDPLEPDRAQRAVSLARVMLHDDPDSAAAVEHQRAG